MKYDLGFLGGGQLARMSIQAAQRMGLRCISLDPGTETPASFIADSIVGGLDDAHSLRQIFDLARQVTLENEFTPADAIEKCVTSDPSLLSRMTPGLQTLRTVQDKLLQRKALQRAGVPSPPAMAIEGDGEEAFFKIGLPIVLKTRFGGYDGKGTRYARTREEWEGLRPSWSKGGWLAESFVPFARELAVMVAIGPGYRWAFPTVETVQKESVCDLVYPSNVDAADIAIAAVEAVEGKGLFGVELFQTDSGQILVNELAPRPHNSGHYTLDWGGPSQFEFHIRTVMHLPAAAPASASFAVMANLLGQANADETSSAIRSALLVPNSYVHWYQKQEVKPGRKMGHINVAGGPGAKLETVIAAAREARERFYAAWTS